MQTLQTEIQTLKSESERYRKDSEWHRSELCSFLRLVDDTKNATAVKHQVELDDLKAVVERLRVEQRSLRLHSTRLYRGIRFLSLQMNDMQDLASASARPMDSEPDRRARCCKRATYRRAAEFTEA